MPVPPRTECLQVFAAFFIFYQHITWLGPSWTPPSEHLYAWTAFWTGCCLFCIQFTRPWPFIVGSIAFVGLVKNLGMLWGDCPGREGRDLTTTTPVMGVWGEWIAGLVVTGFAFGGVSLRAHMVRLGGDAAGVGSARLDGGVGSVDSVGSVRLDEEEKV